MRQYYWLKMYHEALTDPKLATLPDNLWRRFWECCILAGMQREGGFLPDLHDIAFYARTPEETLRSELGGLAMRGLLELRLDESKRERWYVTNFATRQAPSGDAERMRQWRKRQKKDARKSPLASPLEEKETREDDQSTDNIPYSNSYTDVTVTSVTKRNGIGEQHPSWTLPANLDTPNFERAWIAWFKHLIDRDDYLTQTAGDVLLERLSRMGEARAVAAIYHSIDCRWKNVFESSANGNGRSPHDNGRAPTTEEIAAAAFDKGTW